MSKRPDAIGMFWEDHAPKKVKKEPPPKRQPPPATWLDPNYLPGLEAALAFRNVELMSNEELIEAFMQKHVLIYDIECYWNYFLIAFKSATSGKVIYFEINEGEILFDKRLPWILSSFTLVGFNNKTYDDVMATLAVNAKLTTVDLKRANDMIIVQNSRTYEVLKKFKCKALKMDTVDLIEVAPLFESLKIYGGRQHTRRMQDLPFDPSVMLSPPQKAITRHYCVNDLDQTLGLYNTLHDPLKLRTEMSNRYKVDLRSKSDAQIAEAVIAHGLKKLGFHPKQLHAPRIAVGTKYKYKVPKFIKFKSPLLQWALEKIKSADFIVGDTGAIETPPELQDLKITINGSTYTLGIGGLHSNEKNATYYEDDHTLIIDRDVTSYYPYIILNQGLFPKHLGTAFLQIYKGIVDERVAAKLRGDKSTADSLKITVNGSFGKFGNKYSFLYSPDLVIQTTITGQLALLMMIEKLEWVGIPVVSANTDGIVIRCPRERYDELCALFDEWERETQFKTEETQYLALCSRDVNSYVAIKKKFDKEAKVWLSQPDGAKTKGAFFNPWAKGKVTEECLKKNPNRQICMDAIEAYLGSGIPMEQTIRNCTDITKFVVIQRVTGGAVKVWEEAPLPAHATREELVAMAGFHEKSSGYWVRPDHGDMSECTLEQAYESAKEYLWKPARYDYLGKNARWYYGKDEKGEIVRAKNGNRVSRTIGAIPCMELPKDLPDDIDYDWYINEAYSMLKWMDIESEDDEEMEEA